MHVLQNWDDGGSYGIRSENCRRERSDRGDDNLNKKKAGICRYQQAHRAMEKLPETIVSLWACKVNRKGGVICLFRLDKDIKDRTRCYGNKEKNV